MVILEPQFEATLATAHVVILVEATAKSNREIALYRWFIDNRLVAETDRPAYVWDLRGEHPGQHWITVHAVDNGFHRSATQIPVRVAPVQRREPGKAGA